MRTCLVLLRKLQVHFVAGQVRRKWTESRTNKRHEVQTIRFKEAGVNG